MKWYERVCDKCKSDDIDQIDYWEKTDEKGDRIPYAKFKCRMDDCLHEFTDELDEPQHEEDIHY